MHRSRRLAALGVMVAGASLALPFATLPDGTATGIDADAWPAMLLLAPVMLMAVAGDRGDAPPAAAVVAAAVLSAGAVGFAMIKLTDAWTAAADTAGSVGPGGWVLAAGTAVALLGCLLGFGRRL